MMTKDPYTEGYAAYAAGKSPALNPYPVNTESWGLWVKGHFAAFVDAKNETGATANEANVK